MTLEDALAYLEERADAGEYDALLVIRSIIDSRETDMGFREAEVARLRAENAKLRQVAEQVVKWGRAPIPFAYVQLAREVL